MNNTISEIRKTGGNKSRLEESEDKISKLEDMIEKKLLERARKGKKTEQRGVKGTAGQCEM